MVGNIYESMKNENYADRVENTIELKGFIDICMNYGNEECAEYYETTWHGSGNYLVVTEV